MHVVVAAGTGFFVVSLSCIAFHLPYSVGSSPFFLSSYLNWLAADDKQPKTATSWDLLEYLCIYDVHMYLYLYLQS